MGLSFILRVQWVDEIAKTRTGNRMLNVTPLTYEIEVTNDLGVFRNILLLNLTPLRCFFGFTIAARIGQDDYALWLLVKDTLQQLLLLLSLLSSHEGV